MAGTRVSILSLHVGRIQPLGREALPSGIHKQAVQGPLRVTRLGLAGDAQADRLHHGGPEKALHHYPSEHYARWRSELPQRAERFVPGGFGENLSTCGLLEAEVCLGDVWRLGSALLQVSQARQPCRRLNLRFDLPDMVERVLASGRSGWYYRVLQEGEVAPEDGFFLVRRPHPDWPLDRLVRVLFSSSASRRDLAELAGLPSLSRNWRERATRRLLAGGMEGKGGDSTPEV